MNNMRTTIGGIAAGLASILTGIKLLTVDFAGNWEAGSAAIVTGAGIIYAAWHSADKQNVTKLTEKVEKLEE